MELFTTIHHNYDYHQLCDEIKSLWRDEDESIPDFNSRSMWNYYRFHDDDKPLK